jgi:hypothetical protein
MPTKVAKVAIGVVGSSIAMEATTTETGKTSHVTSFCSNY